MIYDFLSTKENLNWFNPLGSIITKEDIVEIFKRVSEEIEKASQLKFWKPLGTKEISTIISTCLEVYSAEYFTEKLGYLVKSANGVTKNPDNYFTEIDYPLEWKVTAGEKALGGEYSNRPSPHLLVYRDKEEDKNFCVCLVDLKKEDWKSSSSNKFYAPTFSKTRLYKKILENKAVVLLGEVEKCKRKISINKESIG